MLGVQWLVQYVLVDVGINAKTSKESSLLDIREIYKMHVNKHTNLS